MLLYPEHPITRAPNKLQPFFGSKVDSSISKKQRKFEKAYTSEDERSSFGAIVHYYANPKQVWL